MRPAGDLSPVAMVTGAGGTLGAAVASALAERGCAVGLVSHRTAGSAHMLASSLPTPSVVVSADVSDLLGVERATQEVTDALGPIGVLVTCAAVRQDGLLMAQDAGAWTRTISVNLLGTYHACRAVLPGMIARRAGRIVAVTSPVATTGNAGQTAYGASKAGVEGLVRSLSAEVASRHVTVNAVSPGFFASALTEGLDPEAVASRQASGVLPPTVSPEQVAQRIVAVVFDPGTTGQVIEVV